VKKVVFRREINVAFDTGVLYLDGTYPVSLAYFLGMAGKNPDHINALTPLSLVASEREFVKWINLYSEFKIGNITLKWVPSVKGGPIRVDAMQQNDLPELRTSAFSCEALVALPKKASGLYVQGGATFPLPPYQYWYDADIQPVLSGPDPLPITNNQMIQMKYPRAQRKNFDNSWSFSWNAFTYKLSNFNLLMRPNEGELQGAPLVADTPDGKLRKFPWLPIVSSNAMIGGSRHAINLLTVIHQPYIAARDTKTWAWANSPEGTFPASGQYGKFILTSNWYFKKRKNSNAITITNINDNAAMITSISAGDDPIIDTAAYAP